MNQQQTDQLKAERDHWRTVYQEAYNIAIALGYITKLSITLNDGSGFAPDYVDDGGTHIGFYNPSQPPRQNATRLDDPPMVHFTVQWNIQGMPLTRIYHFDSAVSAKIIHALKNPVPKTQVVNPLARPGIRHPEEDYGKGEVVWTLLYKYTQAKNQA